ncbi:type I restriction enzyme, S subunit [Trichococcus ilyis]|uniref:Restriction endonuclease type i hsds n=2 Tax=Trichococcus ilyis TaxID=640938 RepID=A0A143Z839_9LACT|nr:restriction endonuclease type i hsds [Trichococcus ilyis]SEJ87332.1 type I restriction enzyme, S subunit [Trichococcus ilyis]
MEMCSKKQQIPDIRFNGFTDAWEQRKLGDITTKIGSGKTPKGGDSVYTESGVPFLRSQNIYNDRVNFEEIAYITESMDNEMANSRVEKGDVLLNITGASIGRAAVYELSSPSNVNQHVCIIRPTNEINSYYIQLNLTSPKGQKQIELNQAGGGREGLNFQQIAKMDFKYPTFREQTKIGTFFQQLDDTIALHQRQLHNYKQLKKAMMQKIFNQELRFKDQDGNNYPEWKTTTLDKICTIKTGNMNVQDSVSDGKYTFFDRSETIKKLNEYSYDEEALIYPGEGSSFYPRYFKGKYALHQRAYSLSDFEEDCSARYVYHYLNTKNNHFLKTCVGTTVRSLRMTSFESCEVEIPSYLEQQEIADFLSAIEKRLENLEQTVELLKEQKKGLMQQMFV